MNYDAAKGDRVCGVDCHVCPWALRYFCGGITEEKMGWRSAGENVGVSMGV